MGAGLVRPGEALRLRVCRRTKKSRSSPPVSAKAGSNQGGAMSSSTRAADQTDCRRLAACRPGRWRWRMSGIGLGRFVIGRTGSSLAAHRRRSRAGPRGIRSIQSGSRPFVIVDHGDEMRIAGLSASATSMLRTWAMPRSLRDHRASAASDRRAPALRKDRNPAWPSASLSATSTDDPASVFKPAMASSRRCQDLGPPEGGNGDDDALSHGAPPSRASCGSA